VENASSPIKLGIALPAYGFKLDVGHAAMWLGLGAALQMTGDKFALTMFTEYHINGIDLCRNTAVYDAMKAGCDWLFMVDADTFHHSGGADAAAIADAGVDILQMIRDADRGMTTVIDREGEGHLQPIQMPPNNGIGLIGAPVRGRGVGDNGVCVQRRRGIFASTGYSEPEPDADARSYVGDQLSLDEIGGRILPVARIGGACIGVNCAWLRKHWPQGPWFMMEHDYTGRPKNARGEDYWICDGVWNRGGVVLCDGRFVPEHVDRRKLVGE
jgi:hypothetical protein